MSKETRFIAQILNCTCAMCGANVVINNRFDSEVFSLSVDNQLFFNCPECKQFYDVPYVNYSK